MHYFHTLFGILSVHCVFFSWLFFILLCSSCQLLITQALALNFSMLFINMLLIISIADREKSSTILCKYTVSSTVAETFNRLDVLRIWHIGDHRSTAIDIRSCFLRKMWLLLLNVQFPFQRFCSILCYCGIYCESIYPAKGLLSYCLFFILKNKYLNKLRNINVFAHRLFQVPARQVAILCFVSLFWMILLLKRRNDQTYFKESRKYSQKVHGSM